MTILSLKSEYPYWERQSLYLNRTTMSPISGHDTNCVWQAASSLNWGWIIATCILSLSRCKMKMQNVFTELFFNKIQFEKMG